MLKKDDTSTRLVVECLIRFTAATQPQATDMHSFRDVDHDPSGLHTEMSIPLLSHGHNFTETHNTTP